MTDNIPPGLKEQAVEEYQSTGTFSDSTCDQVADIVKAHPNHHHIAAAGVVDWKALIKQILMIVLDLLSGSQPPGHTQ